MLLPDLLVLPLLPAGLLFQSLYGDGLTDGFWARPRPSPSCGRSAPPMAFCGTPKALGGGDVKLAGALGAWLGILKIPFFLLGAFATGVVVMGLFWF